MNIETVKSYYLELQARIVANLEALDGLAFRRDGWERAEGGGGLLPDRGWSRFERGGSIFARHRHPSAAHGQRHTAELRP
jgi:coproporphyrinogen III oxidase